MQTLELSLDSFVEFDVDELSMDDTLLKARVKHKETPANEWVKYSEFQLMQAAMHLMSLPFDLSSKKNRQKLKAAMSMKTQRMFDKMKMKNLASPKLYSLRIDVD